MADVHLRPAGEQGEEGQEGEVPENGKKGDGHTDNVSVKSACLQRWGLQL